MPGHVSAPFKYTIPVLRATSNEAGELFLEGEASGPEVDTFGTRIDPSLLVHFAEQIVTRASIGDPIPYRDTHGQGVTGDNPVMSDLGELVAAVLTPEDHLLVRVRLDKENPAALYLHKQITRGKRFGMSIGGTVVDFADEYVRETGRIVRTFKNVVLDHIANTSQPSWTPSLGTVLMRAVEKAIGENMDPEVPAPETPAAEGAEETPVEAAAVEETVVAAEEAPAEEPAAEETADEAVAEEPTAEVRTIEVTALQPIADAVTALASAMGNLMAIPTTPAVAPVVARSEASDDAARSVESESPVTGNDEVAVLRTAIESLQTELAKANDRIAQLEAEPAGTAPDVIERSESTVLRDELSKLDPHQRLLVGLQAAKAANTPK